jgi:hypothetical protein
MTIRKLEMDIGLSWACFEFCLFEASKIQIKMFKKFDKKYLDIANVVLFHYVNFQNKILCFLAQ